MMENELEPSEIAADHELAQFEAVEIEEIENLEPERVDSIIESLLFATDRAIGVGQIKSAFKGTNVTGEDIKRSLDRLAVEYAGGSRGVNLEEVPGGFQLRTKIDNADFLKRSIKPRTFRLSGPALEVLSIVAYKQPVIKHEVDEIRGVESGHLLRALMERDLVSFEGKSELPGKPMQYGTTKKFLEIFGLRHIKEIPTLSQVDELIPNGIGDEEIEKPKLADITGGLSQDFLGSYSQSEEELGKIQVQLTKIDTTTAFFEEEKIRQKEQKDQMKAQDLREALTMDEALSTRDANWLKKFDEAIAAGTSLVRQESAKFAAMKAKKAEKPAASDDVANIENQNDQPNAQSEPEPEADLF